MSKKARGYIKLRVTIFIPLDLDLSLPVRSVPKADIQLQRKKA